MGIPPLDFIFAYVASEYNEIEAEKKQINESEGKNFLKKEEPNEATDQNLSETITEIADSVFKNSCNIL